MSENLEDRMMAVVGKFDGVTHWFVPPQYVIIITPPEEIREKLKQLYHSKEEFDIGLQSDGTIMVLETAKIKEWKRKQKAK